MEPIPIAFQGEIGAYSQQAIEEFGAQHDIGFTAVPTQDFDALFKEISGGTGLGMVPIENSAAGLVFNAMDLFLQHDLQIIGEYYLQVRHFLLGHKDEENTDLEGKIVHSHPQAIVQCKEFIARTGLRAQFDDDTAGSARYVSELPEEEKYGHLAIASETAAKTYGLDVIAENIQDKKKNTTKFLVVRPAGRKSDIEDRIKVNEGMYKVTVSYSVLPWELRKVLNLVHEAGYRTNNIDSRPADETDDSDRVFNRISYSTIGMRSKSIQNLDGLLDAIGKEIGKDNVKSFGIYPAGRIMLERYHR